MWAHHGKVSAMHALKARVENGRLVMDEPTDLPEGTVLELVPANDEEDLDISERRELLKSIEEGLEDFERGEVEDALTFAQRLMTAKA